jgi:hypothetical protein
MKNAGFSFGLVRGLVAVVLLLVVLGVEVVKGADLSITATSVAPSSTATLQQVTFGETVTAGQVLYAHATDGKYYKARGNATGTATPAGIACVGGAANQKGLMVVKDATLTIGATVTSGTVLVLSYATAGGIAPVTDLAADDVDTVYVRVFGVAGASNKISVDFNTGRVISGSIPPSG